MTREQRSSQRTVPDGLLAAFSDFLAERVGLHFPRQRWADLERGTKAAASELRFADAQTCIQSLMACALSRPQIEILASHLTVGETYYFRERESFRCLEQHLIPELLRLRAGQERRLRIWSAGCCTGEEPYSLAILLARMISDLRGWNISILATDINPRFLQKASLGVYGDWSFRDTPPGIREGFFRRTAEGRFQIAPHIRSMVTFGYLNLAEDAYPSVESGTNAMDIIFCRNVLMYFEPAHSRKVLEKLSRSLVDGGWLFVSPIEISQVALPQLAAVNFPGVIAYRKQSNKLSAERVASARPIPEPTAFDTLAHTANFPASWESTTLHQPEPVPPPSGAESAQPNEAGAPVRSPSQDASELYGLGRYAEAAEKLNESLSRDPGDVNAMVLLARTYANQGRLMKARDWCEKAVAADRLNPALHYLLAIILQELGASGDAVAALKRALYLDQDHALAHYALGGLIRGQGNRRESERHFRNALSILSGYRQDQILAESEGITAGRLAEIIRSSLSSEVRT